VRNDTAQRLDPLGGLTARPFVIGAVAVSLLVSVSMSIASASQVSYPPLEVAGLLALVAAGVLFIRAASPFRAPFPLRAHATVCLLALLAILLNSLAQWGSNEVVRDDWGAVALAILTLMFGSYRPGWEIMVCAAVCSAVIAGLAVAQAHTFVADVPAPVFGILAAVPVLAAGAAASTFSRSLVGSLLQWRSAHGRPAASVSDGDDGDDVGRPDAARASHLVHLTEQVFPFLEGVVRDPQLSAADGDRARVLARELRTLMVIDAERSWLMRLVRDVRDPQHVADGMGEAERGYVRAMVGHMRRDDGLTDERMRLTLDAEGSHASCTLSVPCAPEHNPRVQLAPYIAVGRSIFDTVDWRVEHGMLTLRLTFQPTETRGNP
jgi:hypothetical protein